MPEDAIRMLSSASRDLTHLPDTAPQLVKAARFLTQLYRPNR
ncbi:HNH nuclease domain-containing protein OS=Streptomyces microflavus OX=1919 GN=Smic_78170 PE=4 SV=1 [Streptomyces microflavus]